MKHKYRLIAAVCAALSVFFSACGEEPVWTNVTEETRNDEIGETADATENVAETEAKKETETKTAADVKTETSPNTEAEAETGSGLNANTETGEAAGNSDGIVIYICGAVANPGVYELPAGSRVIRAIEAAGGLLEDADPFLVNQARLLEDGEQIRILTREEAEQMDLSDNMESLETGLEDSEKEGKININTADVDMLMTLPGIGQAKAEAIVEYRKNSGGFQKIEDIMNISGVKEAVFAKIKDKITVS